MLISFILGSAFVLMTVRICGGMRFDDVRGICVLPPPPPELFPPVPWSTTPGEPFWTRIPMDLGMDPLVSELALYSAACCACCCWAPGELARFLANRSASSSSSLDRIDRCDEPP